MVNLRSKTSIRPFGDNFPFSISAQVEPVCAASALAVTAFCPLATLRSGCSARLRLVTSATTGVITPLRKRLALAHRTRGRTIRTPGATTPEPGSLRTAGFCLATGVGAGLGETAALAGGGRAPGRRCAAAPGAAGATTCCIAVFQSTGLGEAGPRADGTCRGLPPGRRTCSGTGFGTAGAATVVAAIAQLPGLGKPLATANRVRCRAPGSGATTWWAVSGAGGAAAVGGAVTQSAGLGK